MLRVFPTHICNSLLYTPLQVLIIFLAVIRAGSWEALRAGKAKIGPNQNLINLIVE